MDHIAEYDRLLAVDWIGRTSSPGMTEQTAFPHALDPLIWKQPATPPTLNTSPGIKMLVLQGTSATADFLSLGSCTAQLQPCALCKHPIMLQ